MTKIRTPFETPPTEGEAIEVADGVLWLRLPLPMKLDHVNVYALRDGDGWCIVDTGFHSKRGVALWEKLIAGPLGGLPITKVLLTHYHPDHVGMVGWFQRELGAELITTRTSWLYARMLITDVQTEWQPETLAFYRATGMDAELYKARAEGKPYNFADVCHSAPKTFTRIKEGDVITLGGREWDVTCGDGHAPEHAVLWSRNDDLVIAGDQVISSISPNISVYPNEPMADPLAEWLHSCRRFKEMARSEHLVLSGHKLPFTGLSARMDQLIENHESALERLLAFLKQPETACGCFQTLFKREIGAGEYGFAMGEAIAHLNHLLLAGKVTRKTTADGVWLWQTR